MENAQPLPTSPFGLPIVVYDLEIKNPIDGQRITWSSFDKMGISVGVSFDYRDGDFRTYFDDNIGELVEQIRGARLVVGFNHLSFDNNLLRGCGLPLPPDEELPSQYDILVESRKAVGWVPGGRYPSGLKLDNHLEGTFGREAMKTGHGELAPVLYQQRKWGPLTSYCIADVKRTCRLFEYVWEHGHVVTPMHGKRFLAPPVARLSL